MFFGIGGYGVAIALDALGPTWTCGRRRPRRRARAVASCSRSLIGLLSLRVRAIFFAMITLAVASAFAILASQLSDLTGGEDGLSFQLPAAAAARLPAARRAGSRAVVNGRMIAYYLVFSVGAGCCFSFCCGS